MGKQASFIGRRGQRKRQRSECAAMGFAPACPEAAAGGSATTVCEVAAGALRPPALKQLWGALPPPAVKWLLGAALQLPAVRQLLGAVPPCALQLQSPLVIGKLLLCGGKGSGCPGPVLLRTEVQAVSS
jgi:hypothetical protein